MPAIAGLRGTGDWGVDERPKNFRETILYLEPNGQAPLQALLSKMGSEATDDPEFSWWEEKLQHNRHAIHGTDIAAGTTDLTMAEGAYSFVAGDLLIVETADGSSWATNEIVRVSANPTSDTSLTVDRGFAGTTAATIPAGAFLCQIGTAFEEGVRSPKATTRNPTKLRNYTQIFRKTYDITGTAEVTKARTGKAVEQDKKRKLFDVMRDMEMASIYGKASETTGPDGKPLRTTGGLLNFIQTNVTRFGSGGTTLSEDNLIDFFAQVFNYDGMGAGNQRIAFVGNTALTKINKLARDSASTRINFDKQMTSVYGMNFTKWVLPQGEIYFRTHPLFNTHPELTKSMMVLNPKGIKERALRKLKFRDNIQENDADSRKGEWIGELGFEFNHEETMAFASGIV